MADSNTEQTQQKETGGKKVLIAVDGSKHSIFAFEWYAENVHTSTDNAIIGFCSEIGTHLPATAATASPATLEALVKKHEGKAQEVFTTFSNIAAKYNIQHTLERLHDPPGASIVKYANQNNVDLIIAGSRGHGTLRRTVLGSVSDYIVHHSHIPVIICKHKDDHQKQK